MKTIVLLFALAAYLGAQGGQPNPNYPNEFLIGTRSSQDFWTCVTMYQNGKPTGPAPGVYVSASSYTGINSGTHLHDNGNSGRPQAAFLGQTLKTTGSDGCTKFRFEQTGFAGSYTFQGNYGYDMSNLAQIAGVNLYVQDAGPGVSGFRAGLGQYYQPYQFTSINPVTPSDSGHNQQIFYFLPKVAGQILNASTALSSLGGLTQYVYLKRGSLPSGGASDNYFFDNEGWWGTVPYNEEHSLGTEVDVYNPIVPGNPGYVGAANATTTFLTNWLGVWATYGCEIGEYPATFDPILNNPLTGNGFNYWSAQLAIHLVCQKTRTERTPNQQ